LPSVRVELPVELREFITKTCQHGDQKRLLCNFVKKVRTATDKSPRLFLAILHGHYDIVVDERFR
jgi:hypothetical protein